MQKTGFPIAHGGELSEARSLFPRAPEPFLDLSTGISPYAYPLDALAPADFTRLPSVSALAALEEAARRAYGLSSGAAVAAAPGTQALIEALPRLLSARKVAILGHTYAEHDHCWRKHGHDVKVIATLEDMHGFDVAVVVNPNNPDGCRYPAGQLAALARRMPDGVLIVDEAFADLEEDGLSLAPALPANAFVLRSFGKTYGLAGVRLGFLLGDKAMTDRLRAFFGPWAISGPALTLGRTALDDEPWRRAHRQRLLATGQAMDALLAPFAPAQGTLLYRFIETASADRLFRHLGERGIFIRRFAARPLALRFGIPHDHDLPRLSSALVEAQAHLA